MTATAVAHFERGNALYDQRQLNDAIAAYRAALDVTADFPQAHNNLGVALQACGLLHEAVDAHREAVRLKPDYASAWTNLGNALQRLQRFDEAIAAFEQSLRLNPRSAVAHYNIGCAWRAVRHGAEAIEAFRRAVALRPELVDAHVNLGAVLSEDDQLAEALAAYEEAARLKPEWGTPAAYVVHLRRSMCLWQGTAEKASLLRDAVADGKPLGTGVPPFSMLTSEMSAAEQQTCARQWALHKRWTGGTALSELRESGKPKARLRVGYLSADFHQHATAYLLVGVLEAHDRASLDVVAYSYGRTDDSPMRRRLVAACDEFVDVAALSDRAVAERIAADRIDVLVDLKGYTQHARTGILTFRPAPIQVQFVGYPGTMGTPIVDYLIADGFVIPPSHDRFYDERIVRMPECYQPNDSHRAVGLTPTRQRVGLPATGLVLCSFNETYKISPGVFGIWMRLLQATPDSVLWLMDSNRWSTDNLRREATARGVAAERLVFAPRVSNVDHLGRLGLADLMLDTFPVNGHTTASDALWAGVPILTCAGETLASRVAGSLLHTLGLDELIATDLESYEHKARALTASPARLADLKRLVAERRASSPLFDSVRFARHLERAYVAMWQRHAKGGAAPIEVPPLS